MKKRFFKVLVPNHLLQLTTVTQTNGLHGAYPLEVVMLHNMPLGMLEHTRICSFREATCLCTEEIPTPAKSRQHPRGLCLRHVCGQLLSFTPILQGSVV